MSFDLMVFDPHIPPKSDEGFREWYEAEVADRNGASGQDNAISECDALLTFYAEMREMFSPFNGPDNVPIADDAPPVRMLRTCEYFFRPHSIYMSFRSPARDMARAAASTLAKALGLGYYHLSSDHGQAVFPDGTSVWPTGRYDGFGAGKNLK